MSGIFGIFCKDGQPLPPTALAQIAGAMQHWGPDGQGCWHDGVIGLGHLLLQVTPESGHETLPFCHAAYPHLVITADARIDNRAELCTLLDIPVSVSQSLPDSTLLLHAYVRWGADCPRHIVGAYAFAIWDRRQQQLFCARDHMGFRPFFVHETARWLIFASDIKGILAVEGVPQRLDEEAVWAANYLGAHELKERTLFHGITKLPPACTYLVQATGCRQQRYWTPGTQPEVRLNSTAEYAAALRQHLDTAVAAALRSAFPIGAHLSGGLDSSSITVLAARQLRAKGQMLAGVFSWSPPPTGAPLSAHDERTWVAAICRQEGLDCHYTQLTPEDITATLARDISVEPTMELYCEPGVQRAAAAKQIRVLLSGWGGDEVASFNGDGYWAELFAQGRWATLWRAMNADAASGPLDRLRTFKHRVLLPLLPDALYGLWERRIAIPQWQTFKPAARQRLLRNSRRTRVRGSVKQTILRRLDNGHLTARLESWALEGAGLKLEYRYPLLDRRLIDFCLALPPHLFWQQGWKRYLFRQALTDSLAPTICWNPSKRESALPAMIKEVYSTGRQRFLDEVATGQRPRPSVSRIRAEGMA